MAKNLWLLIFGRLTLSVFLLFLSGLAWSRGTTGTAEHASLPIFFAVVALSLLYVAALKVSENLFLQSLSQLSVDLLLITWLVWVTGDVNSPFSVLYVVFIAVVSLILGPGGAIASCLISSLVFTALSISTVSGWLQSYAGPHVGTSFLGSIQRIGLHDVTFLVVGLLSARLRSRQSRSDVRLIAATQTLANLRALHERIVESIRSGVVTTDMKGRIFTFNKAAEDITGYRASDLSGKEATILFGNLSDRVEESMASAAENVTSPRYEADCLTPEGLRLRLGFSIVPLNDENNETSGLVITFQDLTEVRALEATSRRQDRLAAVGRVAASIAHEIRNPLAAMRGSIQVLRSEVESGSSQAELMNIVLNESDRLNKIITDYLIYARPAAHNVDEVDVCELLRETFTLIRHDPLTSSKHTLETVDEHDSLIINADPAQIKQVFWNLARNALQAMPEGGILKSEVERRAPRRARILFSDTGKGMKPEQVEHLFEPFSSGNGGTGLGLSIVYQIIREHGGTINVRSREGAGTIITIDLPLVSHI